MDGEHQPHTPHPSRSVLESGNWKIGERSPGEALRAQRAARVKRGSEPNTERDIFQLPGARRASKRSVSAQRGTRPRATGQLPATPRGRLAVARPAPSRKARATANSVATHVVRRLPRLALIAGTPAVFAQLSISPSSCGWPPVGVPCQTAGRQAHRAPPCRHVVLAQFVGREDFGAGPNPGCRIARRPGPTGASRRRPPHPAHLGCSRQGCRHRSDVLAGRLIRRRPVAGEHQGLGCPACLTSALAYLCWLTPCRCGDWLRHRPSRSAFVCERC